MYTFWYFRHVLPYYIKLCFVYNLTSHQVGKSYSADESVILFYKAFFVYIIYRKSVLSLLESTLTTSRKAWLLMDKVENFINSIEEIADNGYY